jgi:predicted nucleic acid-binding protein
VTAAVIAARRKLRRRAVDLMIAATAIVAETPLYDKSDVSSAWITS